MLHVFLRTRGGGALHVNNLPAVWPIRVCCFAVDKVHCKGDYFNLAIRYNIN